MLSGSKYYCFVQTGRDIVHSICKTWIVESHVGGHAYGFNGISCIRNSLVTTIQGYTGKSGQWTAELWRWMEMFGSRILSNQERMKKPMSIGKLVRGWIYFCHLPFRGWSFSNPKRNVDLPSVFAHSIMLRKATIQWVLIESRYLQSYKWSTFD